MPYTDAQRQIFHNFEKATGIVFDNKELLYTAFTHSSFAKRKRQLNIQDNERLEFLGDAVLKLVISEYLFNHYPECQEGDLTKIRSRIISDQSLSFIANHLNMGPYILFSYGERNTGGEKKTSNLANVFEALLGSYYLDKGLGATKTFLVTLLEEEEEAIMGLTKTQDHKTVLQELLQQHQWPLPEYNVFKEEGPDHKKIFLVEAIITIGKNIIKSIGQGNSKKEAEQCAAKFAIEHLNTVHPL